MQHKLLGSTALVSAGFLLASASSAHAQAQPIELTLSGFTEFGVVAGTDNTLTNDADRGYAFFMDNEFIVVAQGVTAAGITYGSKVELEVGTGGLGGTTPDVFIDEVGLFFSGAFGRLELGRDDGAEDIMFLDGRIVSAGTGGFDGDPPNAAPFRNFNTADAAKITYFSPRVAGFQLGASYTPDTGDDGGRDNVPGHFEDVVGAGVNWVGGMAGFDVGLSAVGVVGEAEVGAVDVVDVAVGGTLGFAGLQFGGGYTRKTDFQRGDVYNAAVGFGFGPANASFGFVHADLDGQPTQNNYIVSADMGLMPGVVLKGDVSYNDDDPGVGTDTWAGVLTVQLNY